MAVAGSNDVQRGPTLGESRVRVSFNPSGNETVDKLKRLAAEFIDLCESIKNPYKGQPDEKNRWLAVAQTEVETAAMYAVKGATEPGASGELRGKKVLGTRDALKKLVITEQVDAPWLVSFDGYNTGEEVEITKEEALVLLQIKSRCK